MEASIANMAMRIEAEACGFAFSGFCTRFSVSTRGERDAVASLESLRGTSRWGLGRKLSDEVTWPIVIAVGVGQLIAAVLPGTSRSGSTILLCILLGLNRPAATEFSFLVGIPTMLAAGGLEIFKQLRHPVAGAPPEHWGMVLLGFLVAAAVSFVAVKWLLRYVQSHTFMAFGWYRIALGGVLLILLAMRILA